ncbi:MAG: ferrous iron transport protein A, partial [Chloroflexi bacterium]|nr:ferrous iron transport protein A [Chloroflexota bacterium]
MAEKRQVTLRRMEAGQSGAVIEILGGHGLVRRLEAMGIRPGKKITKVSSTFLRGPVTFKVDHTQIAIGFGMANKIVVE